MKAEDVSSHVGKFYLKALVLSSKKQIELRSLETTTNLNTLSKIAFWASHLSSGKSALEMLIEVTRWGVGGRPVELTCESGVQELRITVNKLHKPGCQECSLLLNTLVSNKKQMCAFPSVEN